MSTKFNLEDLEMILAAKELDISTEKQTLVIEELKSLIAELDEKEKKVKIKNQFLVLPIVQDETELELFKDRAYVVLQAPVDLSASEVETFLHTKLKEVTTSSNYKKTNGIKSISYVIGKIKAKDLRDEDAGFKISIKTKTPVEGIPMVNDSL